MEEERLKMKKKRKKRKNEVFTNSIIQTTEKGVKDNNVINKQEKKKYSRCLKVIVRRANERKRSKGKGEQEMKKTKKTTKGNIFLKKRPLRDKSPSFSMRFIILISVIQISPCTSVGTGKS